MTVQSPKVALSDGFLGAFARIPKAQQKKVQEFISKFRQDPTSNGLNYEKIHDARSPNVHSVRIDQPRPPLGQRPLGPSLRIAHTARRCHRGQRAEG